MRTTLMGQGKGRPLRLQATKYAPTLTQTAAAAHRQKEKLGLLQCCVASCATFFDPTPPS